MSPPDLRFNADTTHKSEYDHTVFGHSHVRDNAAWRPLNSLFRCDAQSYSYSSRARGSLAVLPLDIRMEIFRYARNGHTYAIEVDENAKLVYPPPWSCLHLSSGLRTENIYIWIGESAFEFSTPSSLRCFLSLLQESNWQPKLSLRRIRIILLGSLENVPLKKNDVQARDSVLITTLKDHWRQAFASVPRSLRSVLFDFTHASAPTTLPTGWVEVNGVTMIRNGKDDATTPVPMQIYPGGELLPLITLLTIKMRLRTAPQAKFFFTGLERRDYTPRGQRELLFAATPR